MIDALAVTCLDRLASVPSWSVCTAYDPWYPPGDTIVQSTPDQKARLLRYLNSCRPVLQRVDGHPDAYLRVLEEQLHVPIAIASFGPTANDKRTVGE